MCERRLDWSRCSFCHEELCLLLHPDMRVLIVVWNHAHRPCSYTGGSSQITSVPKDSIGRAYMGLQVGRWLSGTSWRTLEKFKKIATFLLDGMHHLFFANEKVLFNDYLSFGRSRGCEIMSRHPSCFSQHCTVDLQSFYEVVSEVLLSLEEGPICLMWWESIAWRGGSLLP